MSYMIGVDVGGTFTDFSIFDSGDGKLTHYKYSSTPDDPSRAIVNGIISILSERCISPEEVSYLAHGTTVATNALIEKRGGRLGLITTKGFKDLMEIGRQKRPSLYDLRKQKPERLIPPGLQCEVEERILYNGKVEIPLNDGQVRKIARYFKDQQVETIAICTLFSFIEPKHESRIKEIILEECPEMYVSVSHELVPEFREYSRMSTTVLNAYLGPVMKKYVHNFEQSVLKSGIKVAPYVTQSNGSIISIAETIDCPIRTAVSGPSAGVVGAIYIGAQCQVDKIITFDMGGTSADISLIENGRAQLSNERLVEGYPCRIPMIDIITVGAGGGSIAAIDEGGALKVGPRSAGATPGPACYLRGGTKPTVTDANVILGKLNQKRILGGKMEIDAALAEQSITTEICEKSSLNLEDAAAGVISVVNSNMIRAVRVVSVERGYDPREFTLMAFGGAGPLHACEVAKEIGINQVLIPPSPGTLCSLGLLMADTRFDGIRSHIMMAAPDQIDAVNAVFQTLLEEGNYLLDKEHIAAEHRSFHFCVDCRYEHQNYEMPIEVAYPFTEQRLNNMIQAFHQEHNRSYGYYNVGMGIQMVNFRLSSVGEIQKPVLTCVPEQPNAPVPAPVEQRMVRFEGMEQKIPTAVYRRDDIVPGCAISGPAIIEQMDSTSVIPPQWEAHMDGYYNIFVRYRGE